MAEWMERCLGDLGTIVGGGTPSRERAEYWHGTVRWLTPGELTGNTQKYVSETQDCITELGLTSSGARLLPRGSLVVTSRATIGSCALAGAPMATNQGFKNLVPSAEVDPSYLFHLGRTLGREMTRRASGTTFLEISGREFGRVTVRLPPLEEQRRIAEMLDTIDETIQATERVIAKQARVRAGLAVDLLSESYGEGAWRICQIREIGTVVGGGTPSRVRPEYWDGTIPWLTPGELTGGTGKYVADSRDYISELGLAASGARLVPEGSLLMTSRASIGFCALAGRPITTNQGFKNLIPGDGVDPSFLFHLGLTLGREMRRRASGTTFLEISGREFGRIVVRLPPLADQRRIAERLDAADVAIREEDGRLEKLRQLRSGLAADLLSGRVRTVAA